MIRERMRDAVDALATEFVKAGVPRSKARFRASVVLGVHYSTMARWMTMVGSEPTESAVRGVENAVALARARGVGALAGQPESAASPNAEAAACQ